LRFPEHPFKWGMPSARRPLRTALALVAVALALSGRLPAEPVLASPAPAAVPAASVAWSFNAGAPLAAPPAVAPDGSALIVTLEGYLHALRADGGHRFSYSVRGRPIGSPVATPEGLVVVAAEPDRLYTVDREGGLAWVSHVAGGIATGPAVDDKGRIWVGTGARTLLAFSPYGGVVGFARTGVAPFAGPVALTSGAVAIGAADGALQIAGAPGANHPGAPDWGAIQQLFRGEGGVFAVSDAGLLRFDLEGGEERWRRSSVTRVLCSEPALVVVEGQSVRWLTPRGEPGLAVPLPSAANAPAACLPSGTVVVARDRSLVFIESSGAARERRIPPGAVLAVQAASASRLLVSYRNGRVVALRE